MHPLREIFRCDQCLSRIAEGARFCGVCGCPTDSGDSGGLGNGMILAHPAVMAAEDRAGRAQSAASSAWLRMRDLITFYSALLAASLILGLASHATRSPFLQVSYWATAIALVSVFASRTWSVTAPALRPSLPRLRPLLELTGAALATLTFLLLYFRALAAMEWPMADPSDSFRMAAWPLWSILVLNALLPGVVEEIAFRGVLQSGLGSFVSRKEATLIQATLFSVLHLAPIIFISHFAIGLLLGWARYRFGHIYFGIAIHIAWNATHTLRALSD